MVPPRPDPVRNPLLIVQAILVGALILVLILGSVRERESIPPTPTFDIALINTQAMLTAWSPFTETAQAVTPIPENTFPPPVTDSPTLPSTPGPLQPPEPIILSGRGDAVVYPNKWDGPAIARISYKGGGFILVYNHDPNGQRMYLLANNFGDYQGTTAVDFLPNEHTLRFEVRAADAWQIELLPVTFARHEGIPGTITGTGDDVVILQAAGSPDLLTADASAATGEFVIWAYGSASLPVINTVAPYSGTVTIPRDTTAISIQAAGPWSLQLTTR